MIIVGSTNQVKVQAVKEVISDFPLLKDMEVISVSVPSDVAEQPLSLPEIIQGAKNRSKLAFQQSFCSYAFGIESGLFEALGTQTGYLEATICCIYDGKNYFTGLSCGFEVPPRVLKAVLDQKLDLNQACLQSGLSKNAKLGSSEGLVGLLTKGRINRKLYTMQSVLTALLQIENQDLYS